jgi:BMFP domain-containing protein YqiC
LNCISYSETLDSQSKKITELEHKITMLEKEIANQNSNYENTIELIEWVFTISLSLFGIMGVFYGVFTYKNSEKEFALLKKNIDILADELNGDINNQLENSINQIKIWNNENFDSKIQYKYSPLDERIRKLEAKIILSNLKREISQISYFNMYEVIKLTVNIFEFEWIIRDIVKELEDRLKIVEKLTTDEEEDIARIINVIPEELEIQKNRIVKLLSQL